MTPHAVGVALGLASSMAVAQVDVGRDAIPRTATLPACEGAPFAYADAAAVAGSRFLALGDLAASWVVAGRIVGAETLVIQGRKIVLHEAVGWSDREAGVALARNSIYRVRSMTKPFTGTAALSLVDSGRVELEDPVGKYLPAWRNAKSGRITVEQLLAHRSGFVQGETPARVSSYPNLRAVADACGEAGPKKPPGEQFRYSDVNSYTLGALFEEVAEETLERYLEDRLFAPLGMRDSHIGCPVDALWVKRVNPTYRRADTGEPGGQAKGAWEKYWVPGAEDVFPFFRASGGILSTTFDYARWLACWVNRTRLPGDPNATLLSAATVKRALRVHGADHVAGYGYHWEVLRDDPLTFGHSGSDGTSAIAVPSEDLMMLFFTQSRGSGVIPEWWRAAGVEVPEQEAKKR